MVSILGWKIMDNRILDLLTLVATPGTSRRILSNQRSDSTSQTSTRMKTYATSNRYSSQASFIVNPSIVAFLN